MISLPVEIKTTMLKSFWIVFCTVSISTVSLILMYIFESEKSLLLLLSIPIFIIPGFLKPESVKGIYAIFNRLIRKIIRKFRDLILHIIYYVFYFSFRTDDNMNNQVDLLKDKSAWNLKMIKNLSGDDAINKVAKVSSDPRSEFTPFIKWIFKSKNWSVLPVIPFVLILSFLTIHDEKPRIAENTYTLY